MSQGCNGCPAGCGDKELATVPYIVYEMEMEKSERHIRRLWVALIVAISLFFATNLGWLIYESQFETISYEQGDGEINNINVGEQGDLINGAES